MRALKILVLASALSAVLGVGVVAALGWLGTERGTQWLASVLVQRAAPYVSVGGVAGSLWGRIELTDVNVTIGNDEVTVDEVTLTWEPMALLAGRLAIDEVDVAAAAYRHGPPEAEPEAQRVWRAPLPVSVGTARATRLTLAIGEDTRVFEAVRGSVVLEGTTVRIRDAAGRAGDLELGGTAEVGWDPDVALDAAIDWSSDAPGYRVGGHLELAGTWPELTLHHELAQPFRSVADGTLSLGDTPRATLDIAWTDMAWPGLSEFSSAAGRLHIDGAVDDFHYESEAELEVEGEALKAQLRGRGEGAFLEVEQARVEHAAGSVRAAGEIALDALEWRLTITAEQIHPEALLAGWPGRLDARGIFAGRLVPALELTFDATDLDGELRGYPVHGAGHVAFAAPDTWQLSGIDLASGPNWLRVDGAVADALDLDFEIAAPDLAGLWPGLSGALQGHGSVGGTLAAPRIEGELAAPQIGFGDDAAVAVALTGRAGLAADAPLAIDLAAASFTHGSLELTGLKAAVTGTTAAHDIELATQAAGRSVAVTGSGGLVDATWRGTLTSGRLSEPMLGEWRLAAPVALSADLASVAFTDACLVQPPASLCGSLRLAGDDDRLELEAKGVDVALLEPLLPETFSVSGRYDATLSLTDLRREPHGMLAVQGEATSVRLEQPGEEPLELTLNRVQLSAALADARLELEGALESEDRGTFDLRASVADVRARNSAITGQVDLAWPDVGVLTFLSPDVGEVGGALDVHVAIGGTVEAPTLEGQGHWRDGSLAVPRWGLAIEGIAADATSANGERVEFEGAGRVGDARLDVSGATDLDPGAGWPTRLSLNGDSILAVQLPEARIYVSPELTVEARLPDIYAMGTVHIPRAEVTLADLPEQAVTPSEDTVVHGVEQLAAPRPLHLHSDLQFTLGDDVHYEGSGLTTQVSGQMRLGYESGRPADASGTLTLTGEYNAYGQTLDLERGQLLFTGPLENPTLDVRAVKKVDQRTVGVQLSGTLQQPVTRIFSDPAASEADALSYLLFGRPLTGNGEEETATLQSAALAMGLQQALPAVQRIGESLGLDEFTVQSTNTDAGALMAGKYLSRRVYVRYTYGLFNRIGGLLLRFRVNDRLSVETRSGDEKSMDLLYTVDKD